MIFLPVVDRELRVASRKHSTFWLRTVSAAVAVLVGGAVLLVSKVVGTPFGGPSLGPALFGVLTWLSVLAALSSGVFLTSDCLSEEMREGTLGFLFLTDLHGYDVVLGKLLATSLRALFGLLAIVPLLGITLFLGGVSGDQFWKTTLALLNALFFSLASGLVVSTFSRNSQKAMIGTLTAIAVMSVGGLSAADHLPAGAWRWILGGLSPMQAFIEADRGPGYWPYLGVNHAVAWALLLGTCVVLPRTWQDSGKAVRPISQSPVQRRLGVERFRRRLRDRWIDLDPIVWICRRDRWQAMSLWVIAGLTLGGMVVALVAGDDTSLMAFQYFGGPLSLVLYVAVAGHAARFLVDARRTGLLELILATSLSPREIVRGQLRAFRHAFGWPLAVSLATMMVGQYFAQRATWSAMAAIPTTAPVVTGVSTNPPAPADDSSNGTAATPVVVSPAPTTPAGTAWPWLVPAAAAVIETVVRVAGLLGLVWFGMWAGLTSRTAHLATLKTLVFVQVIPWFVVTFASILVIPLLMIPTFRGGRAGGVSAMSVMQWLPIAMLVAAGVLNLAKDFGFIIWSRRALISSFRIRATDPAHAGAAGHGTGGPPPRLNRPATAG